MSKVKDAIMKWRMERAIKRISKKLEEARPVPPIHFSNMDDIFSDDRTLDLPEDDDIEDEEVTELVDAIVSFAAERAADNFADAVDGMRVHIIADMLRMIRDTNPRTALKMLKSMLYAHGMKAATEELDIIALCEDYCDYIYVIFIDAFLHNREIERLLMRDSFNVIGGQHNNGKSNFSM